jgi:uncharacterized protein
VKYLFDSSAIIEIIKGNPVYAQFKYAKIVITIFNLIELHCKLIRDFNKNLADKMLYEYSNYVLDVDFDSIKKANEFKLQHKKKRLSVADCIGYINAQKHRLKFLTGDKEFKNMKGVEFLK